MRCMSKDTMSDDDSGVERKLTGKLEDKLLCEGGGGELPALNLKAVCENRVLVVSREDQLLWMKFIKEVRLRNTLC